MILDASGRAVRRQAGFVGGFVPVQDPGGDASAISNAIVPPDETFMEDLEPSSRFRLGRMTCRELIKHLQQMPEEFDVRILYDGGHDYLAIGTVKVLGDNEVRGHKEYGTFICLIEDDDFLEDLEAPQKPSDS